MTHDVFLSHSSKNKGVADACCAALEAAGLRCWVAPRDVTPGQEYGEAIVNAISTCRLMVLIFSREANSSPHIRREVERALSKNKVIIPFRIEDIPPTGSLEYALSGTHWLDAITPNLESGIRELVVIVRRILNPADAASPSNSQVSDSIPSIPNQTENVPTSEEARILRAKKLIKWPAYIWMGISRLCLIFCGLIGIVVLSIADGDKGGIVVMTTFPLLGLSFTAWASKQMLHTKYWRHCVDGALVLIIFTGFCTLPVGLWVLAVLFNRDVRFAFEQARKASVSAN